MIFFPQGGRAACGARWRCGRGGEVVELFALFFKHCARHCLFLDPKIHTPAATGSCSPFLFTCICTDALRYCTKRKDDLYRKCLRIAKRIAFDIMSKGYKSTEICQGFLLLYNWNQPAERFEEERTWSASSSTASSESCGSRNASSGG
ncbi:hypothetical protein AAT19DRAFT_9850 [Rhodotorula toruloides]|uniref:Uncharacterized protein n=1 Tax=Rhodotorula toruloides TaxID=5286 RepID=A0A2T0A173_RHOTO|nr:hypothetical protein AAT19DRAFT_9850 [Rhodotorula toruloides]